MEDNYSKNLRSKNYCFMDKQVVKWKPSLGSMQRIESFEQGIRRWFSSLEDLK